jgi:hypothetical protein
MNRGQFLHVTSVALTSGALLSGLPDRAEGEPARDESFLRHRFGLDYVPSHNWSFCYNDWDPSAIERDFDHIAGLGADHLRVMVIWPWFQPNPACVSAAHLDRLDQLMQLAAERRLDVMPTLFTGWLSGYHFNPPYLNGWN